MANSRKNSNSSIDNNEKDEEKKSCKSIKSDEKEFKDMNSKQKVEFIYETTLIYARNLLLPPGSEQ